MSDKKLVGEAARKANLEKARKLVSGAKTAPQHKDHIGETPEQTMHALVTQATTDNKEVLSDATATVVQKEKKSKAKKPTAAELGVAGVVGNRGKVRSENPASEIPPKTQAEINADLAEYWKDATAHHAPEGYGIAREIERKLGRPWWTIAEKGESIASLMCRAIRSLSERQVTAPAVALTPTITRIETPTQIILTAPAAPKPIVVRTVKLKTEGPSNKEIVYKEWLKVAGTPDINVLAKLVPDVALTSIKSWISGWGKNQNLPACAKEFPTTMKGQGDTNNIHVKSK